MKFARALAVLALGHKGRLEVPAPPENIGYLIAHKPDGALSVSAWASNGR